MTETAIYKETVVWTEKKDPGIVCVVVWRMCGHVSVCAESSYLRVISQSPEFDTMRSAQLRRRHTLLF